MLLVSRSPSGVLVSHSSIDTVGLGWGVREDRWGGLLLEDAMLRISQARYKPSEVGDTGSCLCVDKADAHTG